MLRTVARVLLSRALIARIKGLRSVKCQRGRDVYIAPGVQFIGAANIRIGDNTCISEDSWLNVNGRETSEIAIDIGEHCFIGRRNFFSSGAGIKIGNYGLTATDCKFICSSHVITDPSLPYLSTGTTTHDRIVVGANCFIGAGVVIIGNISIGHGSVIGAGAQVMRDIPPFSVVVGNPARVTKRYSFARGEWVDVAIVASEAALNYPNEHDYLASLARTPTIAMPLVAASSAFGNL